jgi:type I restriction-modification system DNA methylase subunit
LHEPLTEHLFRAAKKAGVQGAYFFQTSPPERQILPPRPAVYVAEAKTRNEAREIHQRLWNLGNAPFLIILLPNEIRVYTGFNFSTKNEDMGLVKEIKEVIDFTFESICDKLVDFRSDSIDSGRIWETQSKYITPEKRVDTHLLKNLEALEEYLKNKELDLPIIHALIGKYVYIRYLYDRGILSREWLTENNLSLEVVLGRNATLDGLLDLNEALENRFNGDVFPLPSDARLILNDEIVSLVASTFKGDNPISGQLHLDFEAYDFSYIPVETLSSIYEQFLHSQGIGKKVGAIYTPEPIADYLLCEMQESKPLQSGMKILDPCCGSGVFLVLAYRRLIELELTHSINNKLKPTELRKILCENLYGVERNKEACYVAEFSLILTLLNYIDPPDLHRNKQFKFPSLHNTQIFECDFFDDRSIFWTKDQKFDWIIGNPPWIELKKITQGEEHVRKWILDNTKNRPVGGKRVCEAFSWRVIDLLNQDGCVGLLVHATSLFNQESEKYRKKFFESYSVVRITNFSNLAYVLFGGRGQEPALTLVYCRASDEVKKSPIIHYAPLIINQITNRSWGSSKNQLPWAITINEDEISIVSPEDAKTGDFLVWKTALWGGFRDNRIVNRLRKIFPVTIQELVESRNWDFHTGLKIRTQNSKEDIEPASYLAGWKQVDIHTKYDVVKMSRNQFRFVIPEQSLDLISDDSLFVSKGRGLPFVVARKPHVVLGIVDGRIYCVYSDIDFVVSEPQIGISANEADMDYLRAVSVLLNSSVVQYLLFFNSSSWGVGRSKLYAKDLRGVSVPKLSMEQIGELSQLGKQLAYLEEFTLTPDIELQYLLDDSVEKMLLIPKNIAIVTREFLAIKLQFNKGKSIVPATASPSLEVLRNYGSQIRDALDTFTEGGGVRHKVILNYSTRLIVCSIEFVCSGDSISMGVIVENVQEDLSLSLFLNSIQEKTKQHFSQWVYVQCSLRIFEDSRVYICKSSRLIDWTRTQALNDADDIIAEILSAKSRQNEVQEILQ